MWKKPLNHKWTEASLSILLQQNFLVLQSKGPLWDSKNL